MTQATSHTSPAEKRSSWRFGWLGAISVLGVWCVMAACVLATWHPAFELFTHTSLHMFYVCIGLAILLTVRLAMQIRDIGTRRLRLLQVLLLMVPTGYFAFKATPWTVFQSPSQRIVAGPTVRVFSWNIWLENFLGEDVDVIARASDADIIVLIEVNMRTAEFLEELRNSGDYPAVYWEPAWNSSGMVILSRFKGTTFSEIDLKAASTQGVAVQVPATGQRPEFHVLAVHTRSPTTFERSLERDEQFETMATWSRSQKVPSLIIGDLNVTPWSPAYRELILEGELTDTRSGFGNCASWPSVLGRFGIPIDHALTNRYCRAVERTVLSQSPGSDHRPISVTIELPSTTSSASLPVPFPDADPDDMEDANQEDSFGSPDKSDNEPKIESLDRDLEVLVLRDATDNFSDWPSASIDTTSGPFE